jgi:hypothetical protein
MKFANIAGFVKLRDDIAASQALITRTEWQIAFCNVIAHAIRVLTCVLLARQPLSESVQLDPSFGRKCLGEIREGLALTLMQSV